MTELPVRIVNLEPISLICFNGYGEEPETQALNQLNAWVEAHNQKGRIFGYNNPDPSAGSPNYGYDACMQVDKNTQAEGDARIRHLEGGAYAVLHCPVRDPGEDIGAAWQSLVQWADKHDHPMGTHQWLEEHLDPQETAADTLFELDLYLPIKAV